MSVRLSTRVRLACVAHAPPPQLTRSEPLRPDTEHRHTVFPGLGGGRCGVRAWRRCTRAGLGKRGTLGEMGTGAVSV